MNRLRKRAAKTIILICLAYVVFHIIYLEASEDVQPLYVSKEPILVAETQNNSIVIDELEVELETEVETELETEVETEPETIEETEMKVAELEVIEVPVIQYYSVPLSEEEMNFVKDICTFYEFDEILIYQIMKTESDFNKYAVSHTNDHGIMQLNYNYYTGYLYVEDPFQYIIDNGFDIYDFKCNVVIALRELDYWRNVCNTKGYYDVGCYLECYNRGFNYFNNTSYIVYSSKVLSQQIEGGV